MLQNTPVQDDYSDILLDVAQSLDSYSSQYLKENIRKNVSCNESIQKTISLRNSKDNQINF